jgi:hypothetical protein
MHVCAGAEKAPVRLGHSNNVDDDYHFALHQRIYSQAQALLDISAKFTPEKWLINLKRNVVA